MLGLDPQRQRRRLAYRIGTVFGQKSQLWFHLPPLDTFKLLADIYDLEPRQARERIAPCGAPSPVTTANCAASPWCN